jgi:hypothetical protein
MENNIVQKAEEFLALAKEVNYDVVALYDKDPLSMQILGGAIVGSVVLFSVLTKMASKAGANKALSRVLDEENGFEEYQTYLSKIAKVLPSAKTDYIEALKEKKESIYDAQLASLSEYSIDVKIQKAQRMVDLYERLTSASREEELESFFDESSRKILDEYLAKEIAEYMQTFEFNEQSVEELESITTYATQEEKTDIIELLKTKFDRYDFGKSLQEYLFVKELDKERFAEVGEYIEQKMQELFSNPTSEVNGEILEYLLENGQEQKVYDYVSKLPIATYLQELSFKYFSQTGHFEFDMAFIANPTPITQSYANYIESKVTANWRDSEYLDKILEYKNVTNVVGHDRARIIIQRVDELRDADKERQTVEDVLKLAKEAKELAQEAKELASKEKQPSSTSDE